MLDRYREVLREPHVARLLFTALAGRMPQGMTSLAILLLLTPSVGYGRAGLASGVSVATAGVANVVLARSVDRYGVRTTLLPAAAVYAIFAFALAVVAHRGYVSALGLCGVLGLATAPISSVSRGMWPRLLGVLGFVTAPTFAEPRRDQPGADQPGSFLRSRVLAYSLVAVALTVGFSMTEIATSRSSAGAMPPRRRAWCWRSGAADHSPAVSRSGPAGSR